jgi:hypothetical protein
VPNVAIDYQQWVVDLLTENRQMRMQAQSGMQQMQQLVTTLAQEVFSGLELPDSCTYSLADIGNLYSIEFRKEEAVVHFR